MQLQGMHANVKYLVSFTIIYIHIFNRALEVLKPLDTSLNATESADSSVTEDANSDLKSPISLVHEMALKRKMTVSFEVQSEKGPPHMKLFITLCKVGNVVVKDNMSFITLV